MTYGDLAARLGGETTPQQVGAAVGRNPLSILIPCTDGTSRAQGRRPIPAGDLPETAQASGAERDDDLTDALGRLPGRQKQAVAYHYLAGLPYAGVAAILGGSADAARRAAADGIAALRRTYPGLAARKAATRRAAAMKEEVR